MSDTIYVFIGYVFNDNGDAIIRVRNGDDVKEQGTLTIYGFNIKSNTSVVNCTSDFKRTYVYLHSYTNTDKYVRIKVFNPISKDIEYIKIFGLTNPDSKTILEEVKEPLVVKNKTVKKQQLVVDTSVESQSNLLRSIVEQSNGRDSVQNTPVMDISFLDTPVASTSNTPVPIIPSTTSTTSKTSTTSTTSTANTANTTSTTSTTSTASTASTASPTSKTSPTFKSIAMSNTSLESTSHSTSQKNPVDSKAGSWIRVDKNGTIEKLFPTTPKPPLEPNTPIKASRDRQGGITNDLLAQINEIILTNKDKIKDSPGLNIGNVVISTFNNTDSKAFSLARRNLAEFVLGGKILKDKDTNKTNIDRTCWENKVRPLDRLNKMLEKHGIYTKNNGNESNPFFVVFMAYPIDDAEVV